MPQLRTASAGAGRGDGTDAVGDGEDGSAWRGRTDRAERPRFAAVRSTRIRAGSRFMWATCSRLGSAAARILPILEYARHRHLPSCGRTGSMCSAPWRALKNPSQSWARASAYAGDYGDIGPFAHRTSGVAISLSPESLPISEQFPAIWPVLVTPGSEEDAFLRCDLHAPPTRNLETNSRDLSAEGEMRLDNSRRIAPYLKITLSVLPVFFVDRSGTEIVAASFSSPSEGTRQCRSAVAIQNGLMTFVDYG